MLHGGVEAGPNAVFAFRKEGYKKSDISLNDLKRSLSWKGYLKVMTKYCQMGLGEYYRSYNKNAFTHALQRLLPDIRKEDLLASLLNLKNYVASKPDLWFSVIDDSAINEAWALKAMEGLRF